MKKSVLQTNLENFICMISQDYDKIDKDLPMSTIHRLLITIDRSFFEHVNIINWLDVQSLIQQFYHKEGLDLNAMEDIRADEIEAGDQKSLVETLIILCSLAKIFNEEHYEEMRDYFQSNVSIKEDQDFFMFVDDVYKEIKLIRDNATLYQKQSLLESKKQKQNEDTQRLLNLISNKNEIIQELQTRNKQQVADLDKFQAKIREMSEFLEKNQHQQDESNKNLQMQESIFENKVRLMEEDMAKLKDDHERRIKKLITNHDLEKQKMKAMISGWKEEKASLQKEIRKLQSEKSIAEKNLNLQIIDFNELKKNNGILKSKVNSLEIKTKSSTNWKNRCEKLKTENKELKNLVDELESKLNTIDRQKIHDKQFYNVSLSRNSRNRLDLEGLANNISSSAHVEPSDEPQKKNQYQMRESEMDLDIYDDYDIADHVEENHEYYGPRDTIPAMNVSPIDQFNLGELINDKPGVMSRKTSMKKSPAKDKDKERIPEDHISLEEAGVLYSVVAEYVVEHLNLAELYTSKNTRERNIMEPFVIEQFFK